MASQDFLKLTDDQLQQKYQLEIELISSRDQYKAYAQAKLNNVVTTDKYKSAVKEIEEAGENKVYQALGKAYLMRKKEELLGDYNDLLSQNEKEHEEISVSMMEQQPDTLENDRPLREQDQGRRKESARVD